MALTYAELESITNDYFLADGKKATDIYFYTSFILNYLMNQQKGLWERPDGGMKIRVPIEYDEQVTGFYARGDTISSDDRESINAAFFDWKHAYGNATVYRIDELKNAGRYAEVQQTIQRVKGAQKSVTKLLAESVYDAIGGASNRLTGLRACMNATTSLKYGDIAEADLVASDGTKPWTGRTDTTGGTINLSMIRSACTTAKIRDGKNGKPNIVATTELLYNKLVDVLTVQQRYVNSDTTAKAGFTGINFEGKDIFPDDYCPTGFFFALNSAFLGFAIHKDGYFMRSPWKKIPDSPEDRSMKIYWDGNMISNNRKGQISYSGLTA
ncbi:MAG: phage major capsid protein [Deltaproteobacteria bacterium]|nr:phage major capsid protein [Deltaproteobacteria bacterium]